MRWRKRWNTALWDGALTNSNGHTVVLNRGSLVITTAVASMLLWQLLPMNRHQEHTLSRQPLLTEEVKPAHLDSATMLVEAIQLPTPPPVLNTEPVHVHQSNPADKRQNSTADNEPRLELTPLQPQPEIKQAQNPNPLANVEEMKMEGKEDNQNNLRQGRALLKILEHGKGPGIEITWPANAQQRENLYQLLHRCFGMRTAMINSSGLLFRHDTPAGEAWRPNLDRFSGFIRQPEGYLARQEARDAEQIAQHHHFGTEAQPVRIFPRRSDALLLGGLQQLLGAEYATARQIQGVYEINGENLFISSIRKDNRPVAGRIHLTPPQRCR